MNCPYCGNEMLKGYIQSNSKLGWSSKKRLIEALSGTLAEVPIGNTVEAYRCRDCAKIIIEYTPLPKISY